MLGADKLRALALRGSIRDREASYQPSNLADRLVWQLAKFNQLWPGIRSRVPFYRELGARLPERFASWRQVIDCLPRITKDVVQENRGALTDPSRKPQFWRVTGGSTAQPVQIPAWRSEKQFLTPDRWMARSWFSIKPDDRLFLIWGHSHLLGTGFRGWCNGRIREFKDSALSYYRFSAYDMSAAAMRAAGLAILKFRPKYLYGYSVALDQFARVNQHLMRDFHALGLKAVIAAAEGFPAVDSAAMITAVTGAPVAMEYGSVETELIAHMNPGGHYGVFWRTYFVEAVENMHASGGRSLLVTSLYPRCFPLIRYDLGDTIALTSGDESIGLSRFERVLGRCNDFLLLPGGERIHSEAVSHSLRNLPEVRGYQAIQSGETIAIEFTADTQVAKIAIDGIRSRLKTVHPNLEHADIRQVVRLRQTVAGKTPMIVRS